MNALTSNPPLRRLLAAWAQSCVGTGAGYVALLLLTYRHLHSSWAISAVLLAEFIPAIAFGSWFGNCADRYSRRRLIVGANVLQAIAYGGLALSRTAVPIVGLALVAGVGNSLQRPALRSALPLVAGEAKQAAAAWFDTCRWLGLTAGPVLAAALFAVAGVAVPLALNGLSFLVAAVAMVTIPTPGPTGEGEGTRGARHGLRAGLAIAFEAPAILTVIACSSGAVIASGLLNVCEPILATHVLHGSGSAYALLVACYGGGMVVAAVLVARRGDNPAGVLIHRYLGAVTLTALGMTGSAVSASVLAAALAFVATGYANALLLVSETQLIQLRVANAVQGRLFGVKDTLAGAAFLVGLLGAGGLVAAVGVRVTLATGASICGVCAVAALVALRSSLRAPHGGPARDPREEPAAPVDAAALGVPPDARVIVAQAAGELRRTA